MYTNGKTEGLWRQYLSSLLLETNSQIVKIICYRLYIETIQTFKAGAILVNAFIRIVSLSY